MTFFAARPGTEVEAMWSMSITVGPGAERTPEAERSKRFGQPGSYPTIVTGSAGGGPSTHGV